MPRCTTSAASYSLYNDPAPSTPRQAKASLMFPFNIRRHRERNRVWLTSCLGYTAFKGHEFAISCLRINCTCREPLHCGALLPEVLIKTFVEDLTSFLYSTTSLGWPDCSDSTRKLLWFSLGLLTCVCVHVMIISFSGLDLTSNQPREAATVV